MLSKCAIPVTLISVLAVGCVYDTPEESPTPSDVTPTATPGGTTATPSDPSATPGPVSPTPTATPTPCMDCDQDGAAADLDCDDNDPTRFPGAPEVLCDTLDQDCNTLDGSDAEPAVCKDGSCAFKTIASALTNAPTGSTIYVCPGTYDESNLTINGSEHSLVGVRGPKETIIDGGGRLQSVFRFFDGGDDRSYRLEGFTLKRGAPVLYGGGLYIEQSSPVIRHVIIERNTVGSLGAGAYLADSNAHFENVTIQNNSSSDDGGGLYLLGGKPTFDNVTFYMNAAGGVGAGVSMDGGQPEFTNVTVAQNTSEKNGGGVEMQGSAAPVFYNTLFVGNIAQDGAAMYVDTSSALPEIYFSVAARNEALKTGTAGAVVADGTFSVESSIFAFNTGCNLVKTGGTAMLASSTFYSTGACNLSGVTAGSTILTGDPLFQVLDTNGMPTDFHLALGSPAINAGSSVVKDPDGSVADQGVYGGMYGASWDHDVDGRYEYFWPGACTDVPAEMGGLDPAAFDCDDYQPDMPPPAP